MTFQIGDQVQKNFKDYNAHLIGTVVELDREAGRVRVQWPSTYHTRPTGTKTWLKAERLKRI